MRRGENIALHFQRSAPSITDNRPAFCIPGQGGKESFTPEVMARPVAIGPDAKEDYPPVPLRILDKIAVSCGLDGTQ
jgi:hypothetical protein